MLSFNPSLDTCSVYHNLILKTQQCELTEPMGEISLNNCEMNELLRAEFAATC